MRALVPMLLLAACATTSQRSQAAAALECPESEVHFAPDDGPSAGDVLLKMALETVARVPAGPEPLPGLGARAERGHRWDGCGQSVDCDANGCTQTEATKAAKRLKIVPSLMQKSCDEVAPGATVARTGYFSWELQTGSSTIPCHFKYGTGYVCEGAGRPAPPP